jgi:hypothetical protein
MGLPDAKTRVRGPVRRRRAASGNPKCSCAARGANQRTVRPGKLFCSWITIGIRCAAAKPSAMPAAYPPVATTARGGDSAAIREIRRQLVAEPATVRQLSHGCERYSGCRSRSSNGNSPFGSTSRSIPRLAPMKNGRTLESAATIARAIASAGYRCPPVPPPAKKTFTPRMP